MNTDTAILLQETLAHGSGWDVYFFARRHPDVDIEPLQQKILTSGTSYQAYRFARDIDGADIPALQDVVISRCFEDGWDAYWFARDVPGADISRLKDVVLRSTDKNVACKFMRDIEGALESPATPAESDYILRKTVRMR